MHMPLRLAAVVLGVALGYAAGCASNTTASAPTPAPAPALAPSPAASPLLDHCPGPSDGPSMIATAIEDTHRALAANSSTKLPPACVVLAFARIHGLVPASLDEHALGVAAALERRGTDMRDVLAGEVIIFARTRNFAELFRAYDRLVLVDTQVPIDVVRLAAAAARARGDSATLLAIIARAAARSDAPSTVRNEDAVLKQTARLAAAINQVRGLIRQDAKYVAGYQSVVANFGTLGQADSVAVYVRRGLTQGVTRASLTPSIVSLVNAMLRHASLYASTLDWDAAITGAMRVDSALPSPATKYLIASLNVQAAIPRLASAKGLVSGPTLGSPGQIGTSGPPSTRAEGCARLPTISASLGAADAAMDQGGSGYPTGVSGLYAGLSTARQLLAELDAVCRR